MKDNPTPLSEFPVSLDVMRDKGGSVCAFQIPAELSDAAGYPAAGFGAAEPGTGVVSSRTTPLTSLVRPFDALTGSPYLSMHCSA